MRGEVKLPGPVPTTSQVGQWPRMLVLDEDTEEDLIQFLDFEIGQAYLEREDIVNDWSQWQIDYWAKPESKEKNFPFKRAANIVIPLSAIAIEAIYARIINTLFSVEPFWSVRPRTKEWVEPAPIIEEWLQIESKGQLDIFGFCRDAILELVKLGTAVGKTGYERDVRKGIADINGEEKTRWVEVYNGGTLFHVPLANFLIRLAERDPQKALWVGEEHEFSWTQMKRMSLDGRMWPEAIEKIKHYWTQRTSTPSAAGTYTQTIDEAQHAEPAWNEIFRTQEVWASFDVDGDGVDEEIVLDFHKDSRTILSARYNWNDDLHRPYRVGVYIPVEGRIYGIGVGKQNEQFQKLITTIHRQRLDNSTLTNMFQLALKKNSGYGPGEAIFPGKLWFLDNPQTDIREIKMSDTYTSQMNNEQFATSYWEKLTGANDVVLGVPSEGTPGTATGDLTRLAEGNKKFDLVLKNVRHWLSQIGQDVIANYQQFGDSQHHWITLGKEKGTIIEQMLQMPSQLVRDGAIVSITVTDSITNRDVQKQQWMGLFSLLNGYYDKQLQVAMEIQDPQILVMMGDATLQANDYLIRRLVDTFKEVNIDVDELLLYPKLMEFMNARSNANSAGGNPPVGGTNQTPGVSPLSAMFGNGSGATKSGSTSSNGTKQSVGSNQ